MGNGWEIMGNNNRQREKWIEFHYTGRDYYKALKAFSRFIRRYKPINFHFLYEGSHTLFRAEFTRFPKKYTVWNALKLAGPFYGEADRYHVYWPMWKRIMTESATVTLINLKRNSNIGKFWGKLFHCMLLQDGYFSSMSEKRFFDSMSDSRLQIQVLSDVADLMNLDPKRFNDWFYNREWRQQKI